jgi:hypothetical protein
VVLCGLSLALRLAEVPRNGPRLVAVGDAPQGYVLLGVHFGGVVGVRREGVGVSVQGAGGRGESRGYRRRWQGGVKYKGWLPVDVQLGVRVAWRSHTPFRWRTLSGTSHPLHVCCRRYDGRTRDGSHASDTASNAPGQL